MVYCCSDAAYDEFGIFYSKIQGKCQQQKKQHQLLNLANLV